MIQKEKGVKYMKKRILAMAVFLVMLISVAPAAAVNADALSHTGLEGKTLSILGDSISTYSGISNNASIQQGLAGSYVFYKPGTLGVWQKDTWWQQTADALGLRLLVNNSWSGSCMLMEGGGVAGAFRERCIQLHTNGGEEPDIIAIYLGTNDQEYFPDTLGTAEEIDFSALIQPGEDGFTYAEPVTCMEAYAIALHKIQQRYPQAEVYCFTLVQRPFSNPFSMLVFNVQLKYLTEHFGVNLVDLAWCGIHCGRQTFDLQMGDYVHPAPAGMDAIAGSFVSAILSSSRYVAEGTVLHKVSCDLKNVVRLHSGGDRAVHGNSLQMELLTLPGYSELEVVVTMGGADITDSCYAEGVIRIPEVTGDVQIRAYASVPETVVPS